MVAALGFFEQREVFVEHLLLGEGDAIDARHHGTLLIATPIGRADGHHLDCLDEAGVEEVRTAAEVGECTLRVGGDIAIFEVGNEFVFVVLPLVAKELESIVLRDGSAHHILLLLLKLHHLLFNLGKVVLADGHSFGRHHIVVETIFNGRTDAKLGAGPKFLHRFGHKVGRRVPEGVLAFCIVPLVECDGGIFSDGAVEFYGLSVHTTRQHILCQSA